MIKWYFQIDNLINISIIGIILDESLYNYNIFFGKVPMIPKGMISKINSNSFQLHKCEKFVFKQKYIGALVQYHMWLLSDF